MKDESQQPNRPLIVDLDGTLIKTDLLYECLVRLLKVSPFKLFLQLPFWFMRGVAFMKARMAENVHINISVLPYNEELIEYLKEQKKTRDIILCTASHISLADQIADHLGIFSEVIATCDDEKNLSGQNKADELNRRFGEKGYDYIGNEAKDRYVWRHSEKALLVTDSSALEQSVTSEFDVEKVFHVAPANVMTAMKALRVHQWVKNILIFVPVFLDHRVFDIGAIGSALLAMLVFGLIASGTYVINDLLDLDSDRAHHKKRFRAFAAGDIPILSGIKLLGAMIGLGYLISMILLPWSFTVVLLVYTVSTLAYSFKLKSTPILDVCFLAGLYTIRVVAGSVAIQAGWSFWLLAFSIFFFLSLALVKRASELENLKLDNKNWAKGRGYGVDDLPLINSMGISSGYLSILVIALYINSADVLAAYEYPQALWVVCPVLLYWISRVWLKTTRGEMDEDPIVFAIKDRISWYLAVLLVVAFSVSVYFLSMLG